MRPPRGKGRGVQAAGSGLVTLNVYDVDTYFAVNNFLRPRGLGIYHCGVEVYGWEWSFNDMPVLSTGSGVFYCEPRTCDGCQFRESLYMGMTYVRETNFGELIADFERRWQSMHYDVLKRNCCHFSEELCS